MPSPEAEPSPRGIARRDARLVLPAHARVEALADRAEHLAATAGRRVLIGIAGSPGSGKSTLAEAVVASLEARDGASAAVVPMDGFHLANATLRRLGLRERKGAIETFDGWGFLALLERLHREADHPVYAPSFERAVDEPVAGELAIPPSARIVVVEGNYLLCDGDPWQRLRGCLDEAWFCDTPEDVRMRRLVARHRLGGRTTEAAEAWARDVDGANARRIEPTRGHADLVIGWDPADADADGGPPE
ncbi:nucleoside/nucleotide kinase family protein [Agromyces sp. MMS24-JH15]|uniref:nucleoside/nucleotide kinase family protein n=1 Tax=Agromyces sp. MMS24-JH15 TaxID=3243765 RepID=UPI003747A3DA